MILEILCLSLHIVCDFKFLSVLIAGQSMVTPLSEQYLTCNCVPNSTAYLPFIVFIVSQFILVLYVCFSGTMVIKSLLQVGKTIANDMGKRDT